MRTLALDAGMGAAGDMLLGTLLDLGADAGALEPIERGLDASVVVEVVDRGGVSAVDVTVEGVAPTPTRTPHEVREVLDDLDLGGDVRRRALAVVDRLATAEGSVHGADPESVHFHEVGADDAIVDICGTVALLRDLDPDAVVVGPVACGAGTVETAHGTYPVPPPAVAALAADADWILAPGPVEGELLTPTGAALLAELASGRERLPPMRLAATGYGAGDRTYPDRPNVLRGLLGEAVERLRREPVALLETVLDDATPETLGALQETLPEVGALDVAVLPATMKASRPGHLVQVVVDPVDADAVARRLAAETGTLGVREVPVCHRWVADRHVETVEVEVAGSTYVVDVKVATDSAGDRIDVSAEDRDARRVAREAGLPVREVRRRAEAAFER
ncbi:MAG: nickel pincer cofactor biosynthesis protein LarC [Halobacteriales archaeon]